MTTKRKTPKGKIAVDRRRIAAKKNKPKRMTIAEGKRHLDSAHVPEFAKLKAVPEIQVLRDIPVVDGVSADKAELPKDYGPKSGLCGPPDCSKTAPIQAPTKPERRLNVFQSVGLWILFCLIVWAAFGDDIYLIAMDVV